MTTIFYKKEGDEYIPVKEYDNQLMRAVPIDTATLTVSKKGTTMRTYNVDIAIAPLIAASMFARDEFVKALSKASEIRRSSGVRSKELTVGQKKAWEKLIEELGEDSRCLEWASLQEVAMEGTRQLEHEMLKMLSVPAVKNAYDHFLMVWKLTKENSSD